MCRTTEETVALVWAVEKVGGGKWAEIKKMKYRESDPLERRSAVDLKDKWRNLQVMHSYALQFLILDAFFWPLPNLGKLPSPMASETLTVRLWQEACLTSLFNTIQFDISWFSLSCTSCCHKPIADVRVATLSVLRVYVCSSECNRPAGKREKERAVARIGRAHSKDEECLQHQSAWGQQKELCQQTKLYPSFTEPECKTF